MARLGRSAALAGGSLLLMAAVAQTALAAVDAETAAKQISERYAVEVLKVRPGEIAGRKVWLLTVMRPSGSGNATFQVHSLAVDQETGALVPSFRHLPDGYVLPPPAPGASRP